MKVINLGQLNYDGSQLRHAFAYEKAGELGATICYFRGKANVKKHLVDLEDSLANDFIKSKEMWHFIIEIPDATITEAVVWQRLFISMCTEELGKENVCQMIRKGDDIMTVGGDMKLSVSIATLSRFSGLIHVGINIEVGAGCPVAAIGLKNLIDNTCSLMFGEKMAYAFAEEYDDVKKATYKVIEV